ncbi:MAG TPA: (2Fe-2S) ferredoxin domain-containing protein [Rhodospirillales bacterium]|nr:(2Fe-2S) ferredoxin domain-containing protein [Rhodospirillales bacterium]
MGADGGHRPYYRCHVFCCINERPENHPQGSCCRRGSVRLRNYMKARAKELGLPGVRINASGCLDRCESGPTMVIYPDGVWYHYETLADVDEILERHVAGGQRVDRLLLHPHD